MGHAARQAGAKLLENGREVAVRIALMQKHRLARRDGNFQLRGKGRALRIARREVSKVVQAALADGDHPRLIQQRAKFRPLRGIEIMRVMRMYAGRARQKRRMRRREGRSPVRAGQIGAGDHLVRHSSL
jgi:hypothetical protein